MPGQVGSLKRMIASSLRTVPGIVSAAVAASLFFSALSGVLFDVVVGGDFGGPRLSSLTLRQLSDEHVSNDRGGVTRDVDSRTTDEHSQQDLHKGSHKDSRADSHDERLDEHGEEHAGEHGQEHAAEHGGHHSGHHIVVDDVTLTVAVTLFMFLAVDMVLLYIVNYRDPNIRHFAWGMLGTTISIFCAVLLNQAARSFFLDQLLPAPFPRGFGLHVGHREQSIVGALFFAFCFSMLSICGWNLRHDRKYLFAVKGIGGHIAGFAFIAAGGHWQGLFEDNLRHVSLVTLLLFVLAALVRVCSAKLRARHQQSCKSRKSFFKSDEFWVDGAAEGEDEAFALAIGFLIAQMILFSVTGKLQPMHGVTKDHTLCEVRHLMLWVGVCLPALIVASYFRSRLEERKDLAMHGFTAERAVSFAQHLSAFTGGWLLLKAFEWMMSIYVKNMALGMIINAFVVTMISVIAIYFLDMWADNLDDPANHQNTPIADDSDSIVPPGSPDFEVGNFMSAVGGEALDKSNHARALRTVMDAFSFLTGLSWEKAFAVANDTLVVGVPVLHRHTVLAKIGISAFLVLLVLPAWLWYVVPKAMKPVEWHQKNIQEEKDARHGDKIGHNVESPQRKGFVPMAAA